MQNSLASYSVQQITCYSMQKIYHSFIKLVERFSFFNIICFLEPKNSKLFQVNIISWNLLLVEHF